MAENRIGDYSDPASEIERQKGRLTERIADFDTAKGKVDNQISNALVNALSGINGSGEYKSIKGELDNFTSEFSKIYAATKTHMEETCRVMEDFVNKYRANLDEWKQEIINSRTTHGTMPGSN